jgi:hypothetical protein
MGITNTISRAELAAITAAVIHGFSHITTDSLTSLHQIKKELSHPNLHRHHIQGDVLQSIAKAIRQSPSPIHFFKVKSHAGIIGNEHADAFAAKVSHHLLRHYRHLHQNSRPRGKSILQHPLACNLTSSDVPFKTTSKTCGIVQTLNKSNFPPLPTSRQCPAHPF